MKINFIEITDGIFKKKYEFDKGFNLIYSKKNSCGKSTLLRLLMYGLGFEIPATKGIKFSNLSIKVAMENKTSTFKLIREKSIIHLKEKKSIEVYILPTDQNKLHQKVFDIKNTLILKNILGVFYVDQEKGWTLLNRGTVIGSNKFNIEEFIIGVSGRECYQEKKELKDIEMNISKYKYMLDTAKYKEELNEYEEKKYKANKFKELNIELDKLNLQKKPLELELKRLEKIIQSNISFKKYIENMKLVVEKDGVTIPVNENTLKGFKDNVEYVIAKQKIVASELIPINRSIKQIEKVMDEDNMISDVESVIEVFDFEISKMNINQAEVKGIIGSLEKKKNNVKKLIKEKARRNNINVDEIHNIIYKYSTELGVDEKHVPANKDYIFTHDLKSLSGTILHKIVFAFKLAYILMIEKEFEVKVPIILDSPSGREVEINTVKEMLKIIQRDFKEHQVIIASIYNYNTEKTKIIEIKEKVLEK